MKNEVTPREELLAEALRLLLLLTDEQIMQAMQQLAGRGVKIDE